MRRWIVIFGLLGCLVAGLVLIANRPRASTQTGLQQTNERTARKPSGFWGSGAPRGKGTYRWKLLGLGVVIAGVAGVGMWRLTRRANAERLARRDPITGAADGSASRT